MIKLCNVEKTYQTGTKMYPALKKATVQISKGEFLVITGRSGSGKSTLLNLLTGIDRPTSGQVVIDGTDITGYSESEMALWRGKQIGIVFQFFQLIPNLSALENLLLAMDLVGVIPSADRKNHAMHLLSLVGLAEHAGKMPSELSGGEQQRVAIARGLANGAPVLVADEPTGNLDSKNAAVIINLFARLSQQGKTIIMVTHERDAIAGATRQITLEDGCIVSDVSYTRKEVGCHEKVV
ncbi:MAG: ABC transporter ATP-binding protein [Lachnospiraceae bacterium]